MTLQCQSYTSLLKNGNISGHRDRSLFWCTKKTGAMQVSAYFYDEVTYRDRSLRENIIIIFLRNWLIKTWIGTKFAENVHLDESITILNFA